MKMTKVQWQKLGGIVITALLAVAAVMGWFFPVEAPEARVRERISIDARDDAYMWNGADFYMYSDDHSTQKFHVDGATGNVDSEGSLDVGTLLNLNEGTTEVVTAGSVIVPISSMQPITSASAVTCSTTSCITTTGFSAGDVLFLRNDNAADVITIDGTGGTVECKTDVALGAADILMLIFGGTNWNCVSNYDNS